MKNDPVSIRILLIPLKRNVARNAFLQDIKAWESSERKGGFDVRIRGWAMDFAIPILQAAPCAEVRGLHSPPGRASQLLSNQGNSVFLPDIHRISIRLSIIFVEYHKFSQIAMVA
jgi:hypothetical protein